MDYLDFNLRVDAGSAHPYNVTVRSPVAGEMSDTMRLSLDDELLGRLRKVEELRRVAATTRRANAATRHVRPVEADEAVETADVRELELVQALGRTLFEALLPAEVRTRYRSSLDRARAQSKQLRLRLTVEPPELALLPWEFLYDEVEGDYICLSYETPLTRYLEMNRAVPSLSVPPPIRILGLVASPNNLPPLDIAQEKQRINTAIQHLREEGIIELTWLEGQTWRDLHQTLMHDSGWHILHFIGHGAFDKDQSEGQIALVHEESGDVDFVSATQLGRIVTSQNSLRLAILNACEGARAEATNLYSSVGTVLVRRGVPAVVSMQYEISDYAAQLFAREFYGALAHGQPIERALTASRLAINKELQTTAEWATPVLHLRAIDGNLIDIDYNRAIFPSPPTSSFTTSPPPVADSSGPMHTIFSLLRRPQAALHPTDKSQRDLGILLHRVREYWIEAVLNKSLSNEMPIDLGLEPIPEAIGKQKNMGASGYRQKIILERANAESEVLTSSQSVFNVFDDEGGSLLILGEPGSGKTTILLELARRLLNRAEEDLNQPVPVVFNLSSWLEPYTTLAEWLVDELQVKYQIPRKIGKQWLQQNRILPLLDGLDELQTERREACVKAINEFLPDLGLVGVIVCCRLREYNDLPNRLKLDTAIRLLPLTDEQVQQYLNTVKSDLSALRVALQQDSTLRVESRSPLMLNLMAQTYQDLPIEEIESQSVEAATAQRSLLMEEYISHMLRDVAQRNSSQNKLSNKQTYSEAQARHWLAFLARNLQAHGQTVFLIEQLQPSWLSTRRQWWTYQFYYSLFWGLLSASIFVQFPGVAPESGGKFELGLMIGILFSFIRAPLAVLFKEVDRPWIKKSGQPLAPRQYFLSNISTSFSVSFGLSAGYIIGGIEGRDMGLQYGVGGCLFGWFISILWAMRHHYRGQDNEIQMVETLRWSWASALQNTFYKLRPNLVFVLLLSSVGGGGTFLLFWFSATPGVLPAQSSNFIAKLFNQLYFGINHWLDAQLSSAIVMGLLTGLILLLSLGFVSFLASLYEGGLQVGSSESKTIPNQGAWLALKNSLVMGGIAMGVMVLYFVGGGLLSGELQLFETEADALILGIGGVFWLWYGGLDVIQHIILRFMLSDSGDAPWNYARFLDYAAEELHFLQKVGGGYIFIHRYLLEHFAAMEGEEG